MSPYVQTTKFSLSTLLLGMAAQAGALCARGDRLARAPAVAIKIALSEAARRRVCGHAEPRFCFAVTLLRRRH